jgi:hypothetical protein
LGVIGIGAIACASGTLELIILALFFLLYSEKGRFYEETTLLIRQLFFDPILEITLSVGRTKLLAIFVLVFHVIYN